MSSKESSEYRLKEVCEVVKESYLPNTKDNLNYIGLEHIEQQTLRINGVGNSSDIKSNKFRFKSGDILFGKLRPYFRKVYRPKFSGICSTDILVFRAKTNFNQAFLFYFFADEEFISVASSGSSGTRMPRADWNHLKETIWKIPPLPTQQKIAQILSSLDDKIELNRQTNQTLEAIAQNLYKEWFVNFNYPNATGEMQDSELGQIPKGWRVVSFEDELEAARGLSYKGNGLRDGGAMPMHNLNSVYEGGGYKYEGIKYYSGSYKPKHTVNAGDLIIANTEQGHKYFLIGYPAIVPEYYGNIGIFSHHIYRLKPLEHSYLTSDFLYYLLLQPMIREQVVGFANGTTVNMLKIEGLKKPLFVLPPKELTDKFTQISRSFREERELYIKQNQTLTQLRDTLLPKLMRGEVEV